VTENKSPGDRLLELVVFGPTGLAVSLVEEFPKFVEKGRHRVEGQVHTARLVGQFAFQMGRRQLEQTLGQTIGHFAGHPDDSEPEPDVERHETVDPAPEAHASEAHAPEADVHTPDTVHEADTVRTAGTVRTADTALGSSGGGDDDFGRRVFEPEIPTPRPIPGVVKPERDRGEDNVTLRRPPPVWFAGGGPNGSGSPSALAIPGYDSLSASQVVQRLEGLSPPELEEVRAYEAGHRQRRTILHRVEQLLSGGDSVPL
jgi:hypothetical protein